jgi:hypothetical protein
VAVLRSEGLHATTDVARATTVEQRHGVLDVLSRYVCTSPGKRCGIPSSRSLRVAAGEDRCYVRGG